MYADSPYCLGASAAIPFSITMPPFSFSFEIRPEEKGAEKRAAKGRLRDIPHLIPVSKAKPLRNERKVTCNIVCEIYCF
jgi:hypothetical protein